MFLAEMEAAGFTFRALSDDENKARLCILEGWLNHCEQDFTDTKFKTIKALEEQFSINVLDMEPTACYRDYSVIRPADGSVS
jgi:hypothetical protein